MVSSPARPSTLILLIEDKEKSVTVPFTFTASLLVSLQMLMRILSSPAVPLTLRTPSVNTGATDSSRRDSSVSTIAQFKDASAGKRCALGCQVDGSSRESGDSKDAIVISQECPTDFTTSANQQ